MLEVTSLLCQGRMQDVSVETAPPKPALGRENASRRM